jgi:FixJ family two-component response regulator
MSQLLIAIVDDEEPVRDATKTLVRSLGYNNVSVFGSANEFLKSEQGHIVPYHRCANAGAERR